MLAGVCATDPFMIRDQFLRELKDMGFAGIQNFPTVGLIDGILRINLEETGMGFAHEIDCIAAAHELDLLTTPYAFDPDQARLLAEAGADIVVAHMGLTTKGSIGAKTAKTLDDCVREVTGDRRGRQGRPRRPARPLPWRTDRLAGRRPIHPRSRPERRRLLRSQLDGAAPHRAGHRPAGPRLRGAEAPRRADVSRAGITQLVPSRRPAPVAHQFVRHLQGRVDPVMPQGRDQLAIAGILGGLGDIGVGAGLIGLEDVLLAMRGREDHHRNHAQERVALDLRSTWQPSSPGQIQVEQDQVGLAVGRARSRPAGRTR